MTLPQLLILGIFAATLAAFLWGRWRHDMVAIGSLLACVLAGAVPAADAFAGFSHPAVITVACVLILSHGLQTSGAVDALAHTVLPAKAGPLFSLAALVGLGGVLSGFMSNVGAMALLMPVALQQSRRLDLPPGRALMPLAFGTILGGMTTLIGTTPNLIVASFRNQNGAGPFGMFDYTAIGASVAGAGIVFLVLGARFLVPVRSPAGMEGFESGAYLTELRVPEGSPAVNMALRDIESALEGSGAQILVLVRGRLRLTAPNPNRLAIAGDILIVQAEADALADVMATLGLKLAEAVKPEPQEEADASDAHAANGGPREHEPETAQADTTSQPPAETPSDGAEKPAISNDVALVELAVLPGSSLTGRTASDILLRTRYGLNLLALSRQGQRSIKRLRDLAIRPGDLILLQGAPEAIGEFAADHGCVPLAERELHIPSRRKAWMASFIMGLAVLATATGLLPAAIALALGVLASMVTRVTPPRAVYDAVDWSVIVLLAALIPVASAIESSDAAEWVAQFLLHYVAQGQAVVALGLVLVLSMLLSDLMNNAATATVMCPIAASTATALGVQSDPFLMAVAVGASCAFLTPIGHPNNTLILGPGGFRFGDYWKLGLPLEMLVVVVTLPMLLVVWPL